MFLFFRILIFIFSFSCFSASIEDKIEKKKRAVIVITTYSENGTPLEYGTGFFINGKGAFVTNNHVLKTFLENKNKYKLSLQSNDGLFFTDVSLLKCSNGNKIDLCLGEVKTKEKIYFFDLLHKQYISNQDFVLIGHNDTRYFSTRKGKTGRLYTNIGESFNVRVEIRDNLNVPMFSLEGYDYPNNKCKGDSGAPVYDPYTDTILGVFTECFIGKESSKVIKLAIDSQAVHEFVNNQPNELNFNIPKTSLYQKSISNPNGVGHELDNEIKFGFPREK